jgi:hypothetical protein
MQAWDGGGALAELEQGAAAACVTVNTDIGAKAMATAAAPINNFFIISFSVSR